MRVKAPITVSALVLAGLVTAGSSAGLSHGAHQGASDLTDQTAARHALAALDRQSPEVKLTGTVGIVPASPKAGRKLRAATPLPEGAPFTGAMPLRDVALPSVLGGLGIPELVLAAYRNAELTLAATEPGCGISWSLLAGIGRIESGHAGGGHTDPAGTTLTPILGPTLDGTLPGNEVIKASNSSFVRAVGPMQFLPSTWAGYASDGNADGIADPNNVFDASLAAGKYLCSGGLNLRDPSQELKAVLRYNNSMSYAADVLSWSAAYRVGGTPSTVNIPAGLVPPGGMPDNAALMAEGAAAMPPGAAGALPPGTTTTPAPTTTTTPGAPTTTPSPTPQTFDIPIPGLPGIPCGILCPPKPPEPPTTAPAAPVPPAGPDAKKLPSTTTPTPPPPPPAPAQAVPMVPQLPNFNLVLPPAPGR